MNDCGSSVGFRSTKVPLPSTHEAQPYTSRSEGLPPTQCVSTRMRALRRAQLAASASESQFGSVSSAGVTYISCSCVPLPKYERISSVKSPSGSVSRSRAWVA